MTAFASVLAAIVGTVAWVMIVSVRSTPGVFESYFYFLVLFAIGLLIGRKVTARSRHRDPTSLATGVVFLWVVLAVATGFSLQGFSYLFLWPALAGSLFILATSYETWSVLEVQFIFVAAPAIILVTPAIETFFQMAQPRPGT